MRCEQTHKMHKNDCVDSNDNINKLNLKRFVCVSMRLPSSILHHHHHCDAAPAAAADTTIPAIVISR